MSGWSARAGRCALIRRTSGSLRWAIWVRSARRGARSRGRSGAGAQSMGGVTRPWVTEPGLWMQWDYGDGPKVDGRATVLFCAWLAWSRFRVVLPLWDRTLASVVMALDRSLRRVRRRADLRADGQREDGLDRPCVRDRGPQPADRRGRPSLRAVDRDVRAVLTRSPKAARRRRSGSRRPTSCRPTTTSAGRMGPSRSSSARAWSSASG